MNNTNNNNLPNSVLLLIPPKYAFQVYFLYKQAPPQEKEALVFSRQLAEIGMSLPRYVEAYETDDDERYIIIYVIDSKYNNTTTQQPQI